MKRAGHLVRRFARSLLPRRPSEEDERWVSAILTTSQIGLWARVGPTDRAHAVDVARRVARRLGEGDAEDRLDVLRAALLHDVGKVESGAGVPLRVVATLLGPVITEARAMRLAQRGGVAGRLGRQLRYPALGAELLAEVGSSRLVTRWAAEHHLEPGRWTVDSQVGALLQAADDAAS